MTARARPAASLAWVIPVHDEAEHVAPLHHALCRVAASLGDRYRVCFVYVDDGSRDGSADRLRALLDADDRVTVVELSRHFGRQRALTAGLDLVDADAVITMDVRDPPDTCPELLRWWRQGHQVVHGPGDFRLLDRRVVEQLRRFREHHRSLRDLVDCAGFRQTSLAPEGRRRSGDPAAPLKLVGRLGFAVFLLSLLGALYAGGVKLFAPEAVVPGWAFTTIALFLLGGIQLMLLGVLAAYVGRVYAQSLGRPLYTVASVRTGGGTRTALTP